MHALIGGFSKFLIFLEEFFQTLLRHGPKDRKKLKFGKKKTPLIILDFLS
jgi:hypothetical protein